MSLTDRWDKGGNINGGEISLGEAQIIGQSVLMQDSGRQNMSHVHDGLSFINV